MLKKIVKIAKWTGGIIVSLILLVSLLLYIYEDDIKSYAVAKLNERLKTKVEVEKINLVFWSTFPYASLEFNQVLIRDAFPNVDSKDTLFFAEKVFFEFSLTDLWYDEYRVSRARVRNGTLHLKINEEGSVNYDILKETQESDEENNFAFELEDVILENLALKYSDRQSHLYYHTFSYQSNLSGSFSQAEYQLSVNSKLLINKIQRGPIPLIYNQRSNLKFLLFIDNNKSSYTIEKGEISIGKMDFNASGFYRADSLNFHLTGNQIGIDDFAHTFQDKSVRQVLQYESDGSLNFDLHVNHNQSMKDADITIDFSIENGKLAVKEQGISLQEIYLTGKYENFKGEREDLIHISTIKGKTLNGGFTGRAKILNTIQPKIIAEVEGSFELKALHQLFKPSFSKEMNGVIDTETKIGLEWDKNHHVSVQKLFSNTTFKNVQMSLDVLPQPIHKLNGHINILDQNLDFDHVEIQYAESDFSGNGTVQNLLSAMSSSGAPLYINTNISSSLLVVENFYTSDATASNQNEGSAHIFPQGISIHANADVKTLKASGHIFEMVKTSLRMSGNELNLYSLSFDHAGGNISGNLKIIENEKNPFELFTTLQMTDLNISTLFKEWNDFGQTTIRHNNIEGRLNGWLAMEMPVSRQGDPQFELLQAKTNLVVQNGRLINLESFKSITEYLRSQKAANAFFKNHINQFEEKLMDVKFETLSNELTIKNQTITIPQMAIQSSAMDLNISGWHKFDNTLDYSLDFRFRELKKSPDDNEFGDIVDDGTGIRIFMKMFGHIDTLQFSLDKKSRQESRQEKIEEEKETVKSILKDEFGLFKKDSTVKELEEKEKDPDPEIEYYDGVFKEKEKKDKNPEKKKEKSAFQKMLEKAKEDKEKKEVEIDY